MILILLLKLFPICIHMYNKYCETEINLMKNHDGNVSSWYYNSVSATILTSFLTSLKRDQFKFQNKYDVNL